MRNLDKFITYKMATELLGAQSNQRVRIYRLVDEHDIEVISIGRMRLINKQQFLEAARLNNPRHEQWPAHLAVLPIHELMTVQQAGECLGLTDRQMYNLANDWSVPSVDLTPWGGHMLFLRTDISIERRRRENMAKALARKRGNTEVDAYDEDYISECF